MYSRLFARPIKTNSNHQRALHWLSAFFFLLGISGCASIPQQTFELGQNPPDIRPQHELTQTPFFPQIEYHCGPAALATVIQFREQSALPEDIVPMIYIPGLKGALQVEMVAATRRFGLLPVALDGQLKSLLREVEAGNPVLVLQNLGLDSYPFWHYAVVVGYDLEAQTVILRSGTQKRLQRPFTNFERTWQRAGYWGLVIVKPDSIPATANAERYLSAVLEVEQTGHTEVANKAYAIASQRWSDNILALTGLGNTAYVLNDFKGSKQAFENALKLSPGNHQLWNNLAYTQAKLGRKDASLAAINQALELAPENSNYQHSLIEIKRMLGVN